jgi:hypothetical protein
MSPLLPVELSVTTMARHAGHADVIRDLPAGAVAASLLAQVEGWS